MRSPATFVLVTLLASAPVAGQMPPPDGGAAPAAPAASQPDAARPAPAAPTAPTASAAAPSPAPPPPLAPAVPPPASEPAATPAKLPAPLSAAQRAARYPPGDRARANELNKMGLAQRRRGQHRGALKSYQAALGASPGHVWARFNLACELAALGRKAAALRHMETLYTMDTEEAARALLGAQADLDLLSLWDEPRLAAMLEAAEPRAPLSFERGGRPGCRGWSARTAEVACAWHCDTGEWEPLTGLVVYRDGHPPQEEVLPNAFELELDETGEESARLAELRAQWEQRRMPARGMPTWRLRKGKRQALAGGYSVLWQSREGDADTFDVVGPKGVTHVESLADVIVGCGQPVDMSWPDQVRVFLVSQLDLVILFAEYVGSCCADDSVDNEHWTGAAFVHPGRQEVPAKEVPAER